MDNPKYIQVMRQVASDFDGISHELFQVASDLERMDQYNPQQKLFSLVRSAEVSSVKTGYEVMQSYVMHKPANDPIFTFIEKKRGEGKSGKLAMVAGLNKFLRVYYGKVTELYRSLPAIE